MLSLSVVASSFARTQSVDMLCQRAYAHAFAFDGIKCRFKGKHELGISLHACLRAHWMKLSQVCETHTRTHTHIQYNFSERRRAGKCIVC